MVPAAEEITRNRIQPAAQMVAEQAVPTAKEFTEGQLKPAAQFVADNVRCCQYSLCSRVSVLSRQHTFCRVMRPAYQDQRCCEAENVPCAVNKIGFGICTGAVSYGAAQNDWRFEWNAQPWLAEALEICWG